MKVPSYIPASPAGLVVPNPLASASLMMAVVRYIVSLMLEDFMVNVLVEDDSDFAGGQNTIQGSLQTL